MSDIDIGKDGVQIDASVLGKGLGLEPARVPELIRSGAITSRCERGIGEDEGRYRLTFFHGSRRLRIVTDAAGRIVQSSCVDFGDRPLPDALRRPGR
jgi:hypothetical protein